MAIPPPVIGLIGIGVLLCIMLSRMPIAFVFALTGFLGFAYNVKLNAAFHLLAVDFFDTLSSYNLTVIPLFILMGQLAYHGGISQKLYTAGYSLFGRTRGGLAMGTIAACAGFAACCGSSPATSATMGSVALPEMRRHGYADTLATGCLAAGGTLGILIPPSVILIIYGIMVEESIGKLFLAGVLPGIFLAILYIIAIYIFTLINPNAGPAGSRTSFKQKVLALIRGGGETLAIFVLIIGGLFIGFFTPSEAGAIGAVGVLLIGLVERELKWQGILSACYDTIKLSSMILLIISGAAVFGHFLASTTLPFVVAGWVTGLPFQRTYIMLLIILGYIVGGTAMDAMALLLLTLPIFFPVVVALGYDPIWFGVISVEMMEIAAITPPVGLNVYVIKGVAGVPLETIFKGILPFFVADVVSVVVLLFVPQLALVLPNLMG